MRCHVREARHYHPVYSIVFSSVYNSAIRLLFFPFYSIDAFCTLRHLFVRFGLYSGFRLLCNRWRFMFIRFFFVWAGSACLLSDNFLNQGNEIGNWKPETPDQRKQALQIREKLFCRSFAFKSKRPSKKVLKQKFLVC